MRLLLLSLNATAQQTTALSAQNIQLQGSQAVADQRLQLTAGQDIQLEAAAESQQEEHFLEKKTSGLIYNGGLSITLGKQK